MSAEGLLILLEQRLGRLSLMGRDLRLSLGNPLADDLKAKIDKVNAALSAANTAYVTLDSVEIDKETLRKTTTRFNIVVAEIVELTSNASCVIAVLDANLKNGT
jgi:hypothetical protein